MYHSNKPKTKKYIIDRLAERGISVDYESGQIVKCEPEETLHCRALYLLRHAETVGTSEKRFMSDSSENAVLTERGVEEVGRTGIVIAGMGFDYVYYSPIPRVRQTMEIVRKWNVNSIYMEIPWMKGIDNAGWEGKAAVELKSEDYEDFYQREILHNIFAKSSLGCSWGEVLLRCIDLIDMINRLQEGKKILLISQGSIFIGLSILLHLEKSLWENYDPEIFFGLKGNTSLHYGKLQYLYGEKLDYGEE